MTYKEEYQLIKSMHDQYPLLVDKSHILDDLLPGVAFAASVITIVFVSASILVGRIKPSWDRRLVFKSAYNATNLLVNTSLGIMGIHYHYYVIDRTLSPELRILGYREVFPMTCVQFGYNLWAIPVGLMLVDETPAMLGHHIAVLLVASVSALFTTGHRWYVPFMYGVLELSSVPLAVMNAFKDNPEYIQKYPSTYFFIRVVFAASFLFIRWYLYLPIKYDFLRTFGFTVITHQSAFPVIFTGLTWLASLFLCLLQLLWGFLVVKGIVRAATGKSKKAKKKDS